MSLSRIGAALVFLFVGRALSAQAPREVIRGRVVGPEPAAVGGSGHRDGDWIEPDRPQCLGEDRLARSVRHPLQSSRRRLPDDGQYGRICARRPARASSNADRQHARVQRNAAKGNRKVAAFRPLTL